MPFRNADLGTRIGAEAAAQQGALGCLLLGVLTAVAGFLSSDALDPAQLQGQFGIALVALLCGTCLVTAWRLWRGKGAYWAMAVLVIGAFLVVMMLMTKPQSYEFLVIAVLLLAVAQGVRGALALRALDTAAVAPSNG